MIKSNLPKPPTKPCNVGCGILIFLPAIAFGYGQLADIWGLPLADQIPNTINLVATVLGLLIGISTYNYKQENNIIVKKKVEVEEEV